MLDLIYDLFKTEEIKEKEEKQPIIETKKEDLIQEPTKPVKKEDPVISAKLEDQERRLTDREIGMMDVRNEKRKQAKLKQNNLEYRKALIVSKKDLYLSEIRNLEAELKLLDHEIESQNKQVEAENESHKKFVKMLKDKLKIKSEKWGFDPYSGKIID